MQAEVKEQGAMYHPTVLRESRFSLLFSNSAGHRHLKFGPITGGALTRETKTTTFRGNTIIWQAASSCFVDFGTNTYNVAFPDCVLKNFLEQGQHPADGYAELRLAFNGPASLLELTDYSSYQPATFWFEEDSAPGDYGGTCNLDKANIVGVDYIPGLPQSAATLPAAGTFIRRVAPDAWQVEINSNFKGYNPFRLSEPDSVKAICTECPTKGTVIHNENIGQPEIKATLYLIRKQVQ
ncbi:MAG: hypothetical protein HY821_20115 [Acidobacteria bacterium]|nr:hypothetical protein [Acidobacteriota bacterium]